MGVFFVFLMHLMLMFLAYKFRTFLRRVRTCVLVVVMESKVVSRSFSCWEDAGSDLMPPPVRTCNTCFVRTPQRP